VTLNEQRPKKLGKPSPFCGYLVFTGPPEASWTDALDSNRDDGVQSHDQRRGPGPGPSVKGGFGQRSRSDSINCGCVESIQSS
jgi:hypothetical protein